MRARHTAPTVFSQATRRLLVRRLDAHGETKPKADTRTLPHAHRNGHDLGWQLNYGASMPRFRVSGCARLEVRRPEKSFPGTSCNHASWIPSRRRRTGVLAWQDKDSRPEFRRALKCHFHRSGKWQPGDPPYRRDRKSVV